MWSLLCSAVEWERYCKSMAQQLNIVGTQLNFGSGPKEYPCLVCSYQTDNRKLVSAYVYQADCELLLDALPRPEKEKIQHKAQSSQENFNRWVAAHLLLTARVFTETRLCTREQFEEWLIESLDAVSAFNSQRRSQIVGNLRDAEKSVLNKLYPEEQAGG